MGCATGVGKCVLITLNVIVMVIGVALLAGGIVAMVGSDLIFSTTEEILNSLGPITSGFNVSDALAAPADLVADFEPLLAGSAIALICLGSFLLLVGMMGCCGACRTNRCCLLMYIMLMVLLLIAQGTMIAIFFAGWLNDQIKGLLQDGLDSDYGGIDSYDTHSLIWNILMLELECCGLNNSSDFASATNWENTRSFYNGSTQVNYTMQIPMACCKMNGTFPDVTPMDSQCPFSPTTVNSNFDVGCFDLILDLVDTYELYVIIGCTVCLLVQVVIILIAIMLFRDTEED